MSDGDTAVPDSTISKVFPCFDGTRAQGSYDSRLESTSTCTTDPLPLFLAFFVRQGAHYLSGTPCSFCRRWPAPHPLILLLMRVHDLVHVYGTNRVGALALSLASYTPLPTGHRVVRASTGCSFSTEMQSLVVQPKTSLDTRDEGFENPCALQCC